MSEIRWTKLRVGGKWNPKLLDALDKRSGAYAVRDAETRRVLYVGESHTDRMWRTLLRHFQDPTGRFAQRGEWTNATPERLEVRAWFTSKADAECKEAHVIDRLHPLHNRSDGRCDADTDFPFGANVAQNPAGLVTLGELVSIRYKPETGRATTMRFPRRAAPVLAYSKAGRLAIVYAARAIGASSASAQKEYARTHWGRAGDGERLAGVLLGGKGRRLGTALEITYATQKGSDAELVNYWHTFAEKKGELPPQLVAGTCAGRAMVRLDGGTYTVTAHGIEG